MSGAPVDGSVTRWIRALKDGDTDVISEIWRRYFGRLVHLARAGFGFSPRRAIDEEDVALGVLETLCRNAANGRFPEMCDRDDLWQLLISITRQKVSSERRFERALKRGNGLVLTAIDLPILDGQFPANLDDFAGPDATPEVLASLKDSYALVNSRLRDETMRTIARLKLESYSNREIAKRLGLVPRAIDRKVKLIQALWAKELAP